MKHKDSNFSVSGKETIGILQDVDDFHLKSHNCRQQPLPDPSC